MEGAVTTVEDPGHTSTTPPVQDAGSVRAPRSDRLLHYGVDPSHAEVVRGRLKPLIRHYWLRMGAISLEDLGMSAYIQGMMDGRQLPQSSARPFADGVRQGMKMAIEVANSASVRQDASNTPAGVQVSIVAAIERRLNEQPATR